MSVDGISKVGQQLEAQRQTMGFVQQATDRAQLGSVSTGSASPEQADFFRRLNQLSGYGQQDNGLPPLSGAQKTELADAGAKAGFSSGFVNDQIQKAESSRASPSGARVDLDIAQQGSARFQK